MLLKKFGEKPGKDFLSLGCPRVAVKFSGTSNLRTLYDKALSLPSPQNLSASFEPYVLPECRAGLIVFVNGEFQPALSRTENLPKKAVILPMTEALKTYGAFIQNQWAREIKEEMDPFAILNAALHRAGVFLYLPPKTIVEQPIQILHILDTQSKPLLMLPRLHLFAGAQSEIRLYATQAILSGAGYCYNGVVDFSIEEDSHVHYIQTAFEQPPGAWNLDAVRCQLKRNSTLTTVAATTGGPTVRYDYRVALTGENGEARLNGIWMLGEKNEAHTHVLVDHQAPHCRSFQLFKGALCDYSHSSFEGKILVRQEAQKTDAFQLNNNLLLSDRAAADSKPNLEIFADDVKASHGATMGQLDKEQLFYMKTRGFSDNQAKNLLVKGFCEEVIAKIELDSLRKRITTISENFVN